MRKIIISIGMVILLFVVLNMAVEGSFEWNVNGNSNKMSKADDEFIRELEELLGTEEIIEKNTIHNPLSTEIITNAGNVLLAVVISLTFNFIYIKVCVRGLKKEEENIVQGVVVKRKVDTPGLKLLHSVTTDDNGKM